MTIESLIARVNAVGNGATTSFSFPHYVIEAADLKVYQNGTLKTLTTHYTLSGTAPYLAGTNVQFVTAPAVDDAIIILRDPPVTQTVDPTNNGALDVDEEVEKPLDKLTMLIQNLLEKFARCIKLPLTSTQTEIDYPEGASASARASKHVRWNAAGTGLELVTVATDAVTGVITTKGDIIQGGTSGVPERLALGSRGKEIISDGTDLSWSVYARGVGAGRLVYTNATTLTLNVYNGNRLFINGAWESIPNAGTTLANTGLTASTLYYIYAYMNGTTLTLEASATVYATDTTYGHKIKSGDGTRTLVGMIRTEGSTPGQFVDSDTQRFTLSWFNRRKVRGSNNPTGATTAGYVELDSGDRVEFLTWSGCVASWFAGGSADESVAGAALYTSIGVDGATVAANTNESVGNIKDAGFYLPHFVHGGSAALTEGYHYITLIGKISGGGTGTWHGDNTITVDVEG